MSRLAIAFIEGRGILLVLLFMVLASSYASAADRKRLDVGAFSHAESGSLPAEWKPLLFPSVSEHTLYELVNLADRSVVRARSDRSASGLVRRLEVDLTELPVLRWSWKIANLIEGADPTRKEGDDYPARIYVTFAYDPDKLGWLDRAFFESARLLYGEYPPVAAINYIWDNRLSEGSVLPNAYSDRARMIVVESGAGAVGRWVEEERNVLEDYRAVFGEEPPKVSGVAVMTDTDDTGESAVAWYGDLWFEGP